MTARITDYEQVVDDTQFEQGSPQTLTTHTWFQTPDVYRVESHHPVMGELVVVFIPPLTAKSFIYGILTNCI